MSAILSCKLLFGKYLVAPPSHTCQHVCTHTRVSLLSAFMLKKNGSLWSCGNNIFIIPPRHTRTQTRSYHPDWLAGAHVIIVGIPALELGVLSVFEDVLLSLEVGVIEANEGAALHADGVDPVQEAAFLEVVAVAADLQLPASEAFALIQHNLSRAHMKTHVIALSLPRQWKGCISKWSLVFSWLKHLNVDESSAVVASYYLVRLTFPEYWDIFPLFAVPN